MDACLAFTTQWAQIIRKYFLWARRLNDKPVRSGMGTYRCSCTWRTCCASTQPSERTAQGEFNKTRRARCRWTAGCSLFLALFGSEFKCYELGIDPLSVTGDADYFANKEESAPKVRERSWMLSVYCPF